MTLRHGSDLHTDELATIIVAFPMVPHVSDGKESAVTPPQVDPVRVSLVALVVPKSPEVGFSAVSLLIRVLVFIKGREFLPVV